MATTFVKPTLEEIAAYCRERHNRIDPEEFFFFYESKGWVVGRSPMKSWRAAVITWEKRQFKESNKGGRPNPTTTLAQLEEQWRRDGEDRLFVPSDEQMARLKGRRA